MTRIFFIVFVLTMHAGADVTFKKEIQPLLEYYCFDCHGDGSAKGDFSMEEYSSLEKHLDDVEHWLAVWRNVRAQIMPPPKKDQPGLEERRQLLRWIESRVFQLDPANPDPGRVTIRRLNRNEYHFAIKDLLGVSYDTMENFPADDTGYGFDTIGEVLSISPLHLEKYLEAASAIVEEALPRGGEARIPVRTFPGRGFRRSGDSKQRADRLPFKEDAKVRLAGEAPAKGTYEISLRYAVRGSPAATDQSAELELRAGGKAIARKMMGWDQSESIMVKGTVTLAKGANSFEVGLKPKAPPGEGQDAQSAVLLEIKIKGPLEGHFKERSRGYRMIMVDGPAPEEMRAREIYARKIMRSFVSRAFRRPLDRATIGRLVGMVMEVDQSPGKSFEDGIKHAMTAVLASPRFLFRAEIQPEPNNEGKIVALDEYALASRLSFFLWSSVPDDELLSLAFQNKLRKNWSTQIERMLADAKSRRFVQQFTGQWLQTRDLEHVPVDALRILGTSDQRHANRVFSQALRRDMKLESELFFEFVLKKNRPAKELISARYSFLNERLARFYGVPGVQGSEHRLVDLHEHPQRGGILGQGSFLVVTSNPTRTSPVKRGLFVLDNVLGTPAPPAPPDVPELEEVDHKGETSMTMRQMMEVHREKSLCASCHKRMDPIGLGLENFNAIGQFRTKDGGQPIDSSGVLMTGEKFADVSGLKNVLAEERTEDFHRCLTEKMMTYAIGRGPEYFDAVTIDRIVGRLQKGDGTLKEMLISITESAPFQKRRGD